MLSNFTLDPVTFAVFMKLLVAMLCGVLLGTERVISHKAAGTRTYALVSMGAALFIIVGDMVLATRNGLAAFDPFHLSSAIITGIGFMGAGVIIFRDKSVTGLTTASGLWVAAGIGMAAGYGFFTIAFLATFMTLFIFLILWHLEQGIRRIAPPNISAEE